ncbi:hypothetical protein CAEBREN_17387 [Caenorhabditis brenneri]|uniref:DUF38 domain-containing protein n=1 Tax=Caenorhabditis brenneri TaxID=135651 RepID=G0PDX3_CAEBE|nr:hypothetical protein CAEBREN_17387 [Caenorhabditis brenneri]
MRTSKELLPWLDEQKCVPHHEIVLKFYQNFSRFSCTYDEDNSVKTDVEYQMDSNNTLRTLKSEPRKIEKSFHWKELLADFKTVIKPQLRVKRLQLTLRLDDVDFGMIRACSIKIQVKEFILETRTILFNSNNFEQCTITVDSRLDMNTIGHEFGNAIRENPNIYHYPMSDSMEYFEMSATLTSLEVAKKRCMIRM